MAYCWVKLCCRPGFLSNMRYYRRPCASGAEPGWVFLSVVCRLKHLPWRSWLGWFPARTRSSWAPTCASCLTSPSTRRCVARWSRQDSFPESPRCSVIHLTACTDCGCFCGCVSNVSLCVYDWGCTVRICIRGTIISSFHWQKQTRVTRNAHPASNLLPRRMCRCSFSTATPASGVH